MPTREVNRSYLTHAARIANTSETNRPEPDVRTVTMLHFLSWGTVLTVCCLQIIPTPYSRRVCAKWNGPICCLRTLTGKHRNRSRVPGRPRRRPAAVDAFHSKCAGRSERFPTAGGPERTLHYEAVALFSGSDFLASFVVCVKGGKDNE